MTPPSLCVWRKEYILSPDIDIESFDNVLIPVIADVDDWQGWAWIRSQPTWIEAEHIQLAQLDAVKGTHLLLLESKSNPSHQIAIYPVSSTRAQGTLKGKSHKTPHSSGLELRGRKTSSDDQPGKLLVVAVSTKPNTGAGAGGRADPLRLVERCVEIGRQWVYEVEGGSYNPRGESQDPPSPLDRLAFCTWTSLGETTRPTLSNLTSLCQSLQSSSIPIRSFLIDAGWQSINSYPDTGNIGADTIRRKLVRFEPDEGLGAGLKEVVRMIKSELKGVEDVGVWMTLGGFWHAIDPDSPLVHEYSCKPYPISRSYLPGIPNEPSTISYLPPTTDDQAQQHTWYLPPPSQAHRFWSDWFTYLRHQGISWVKVDNQASLTILSGVEGAECMEGMWQGMVSAAEEVFGSGRVLHCMAHSERMFNGPIGLGMANGGKKIVNRNTDDYGRLWLRNPHQDHIFQNLYNSILTSHLDVIPDGDMFMSLTEAPVYHAILRALMPGPILLTDKAGQHDLNLVRRFLGEDKRGDQVVLKTIETVRPLANRVFQLDCRGGATGVSTGRALVGSVHVKQCESSILGYWNTRENTPDHRVSDHVTRRDLLDSFPPDLVHPGGSTYIVYKPGYCSHFDWAFWDPMDEAERIIPIELNHLAAETVLVAPLRWTREGDVKVAVLGLIDKFAGLVAVSRIEVEVDPQGRPHVSFQVSSTGRLGLVITGPESLDGMIVRTDGRPVAYERHDLVVRRLESRVRLVTIEIERDGHGEGNGGEENRGWGIDITV